MYHVTLRAVVSSGKLISFARSKGSSVELAGSIMSMNAKLDKLYRENEAKVIHNLFTQAASMLPYAFDYSIEIINTEVEPITNIHTVECQLEMKATKVAGEIYDLVHKTFEELCVAKEESEREDLDYLRNLLYKYHEAGGGIVLHMSSDTYARRAYVMRYAAGVPNYQGTIKLFEDAHWKFEYAWRISDGFKYNFTGLDKDLERYNIKGTYSNKDRLIGGDVGVWDGDRKYYKIPIISRKYKEGEPIRHHKFSLKYSNDEISRVSQINISPLNK